MLAPLVLSLLLTSATTPGSAPYGQSGATEQNTDVRALPTEADQAKKAEYSKVAEQREPVSSSKKKDGGQKPQGNPPVPEPATFALVGAALLMLAFLMRRRAPEGDPQS